MSKTVYKCPRCGGRLEESDVREYAFVCHECDENFYGCEAVEEEGETFRYFANVMGRIEFEIEAASEREADELAAAKLDSARWDEFTETGAEIGRYDGDSYDEVLRYGDM